MRILHILDHSLPLHSGYSLRTRAMMRAQQARGWGVRGVTSRRQGADDPLPYETEALVFYRTPGRRNPVPWIGELVDVVRLCAAIVKIARSDQIDVLHAHSPALNGLAGLLAARLLRLPLVYEVRAFWEDAAHGNGTGQPVSWRARATRWLEDFVVRHADARIAICAGLARELAARGGTAADISIVPNGVDMARLGPPRPRDDALAAALHIAPGSDVIAYIGSLYPYEGVDDLIAALPALLQRRPQCVLLLVGDGPAAAALRAQALASPAAAHIRFVGPVPHAAVDAYYACADVLVYPRKQMRLTDLVTPLKPLEAMAHGRLVAASSVGGHRELICDGITGTLFAPDDPRAMAEALAALLADRASHPARRAAARAFVAKERNWADLAGRYEAVYHRVRN
ncbi:MAG: TIGR04063 family PEP-CTERM/XrtA system glycosyltransferase [Chakrabartia sp.]